MTRVLGALFRNTSLAAARQLFAEQHMSSASVVDDQGRLLRVVTVHDSIVHLQTPPPQWLVTTCSTRERS
ncbi:MAG: CBS domain-containing protein [Myxococcales bacterium]|nr:CBS domain-containing protein [Polyangiaceae bacterium]MDW8250898.1 CBS domain-containing protein [Myxococcales bacterium]